MSERGDKMEFLKKLFEDGALTWEQFVSLTSEMKLVDLKEGNYVSKEKYESLLDEKTKLSEQLTDRDKQLNDLKKLDPEKMQEKIKELEEANKKVSDDFKKEIHQNKVNSAIEIALNKANAKNLKAVRALLNIDIDSAVFGDDGTLQGLDEAINGIKSSDSYLFESNKPQGFVSKEPAQSEPNNIPDKPKTYEDFVKMVEKES